MSLRFKGEESLKKKKKKSKKREQDEEQAEQDQLDDDRQMEGWVACESIQDWDGPILLLSTATEPPSILCAHEESEKITWRRLKEEEIGGGVGNASIEEFEPSQVYQVFVARRLIGGTESAPSQKISLRSAYDKYLGVDKFGVVECFREAVGPTEEWEVVKRDDGFVLKSAYDKFLKLDIDGGASSTTSGTVLARADAEQAGFLETLLAKCQAERKHRKDKKRKKQKEIDAAELEIEQIKKFHSNSLGKLIATTEDVRDLKKAKLQGNLNEIMLERRAKLKSDKFCK